MEKKYAPSRKRLDKARKEGNVPKSQYLSQTAGIFAGILIGFIYLSNSWVEHKILIEYIWTEGFRSPGKVAGIAASKYLILTFKLLLIVSVVNILTELIQVGLHLEPVLLMLKLDRVNPLAGTKKLVENVKRSWLVVLRFFIIFTFLAWFFYGLAAELEGLVFLPFSALAPFFYSRIMNLTATAGTLLLLLALLDYYLQRRKWFNNVGMSVQDMKQEHKEDEGDPHVKAMRKYQHRELLQQALIKRIRAARVVIVERAAQSIK